MNGSGVQGLIRSRTMGNVSVAVDDDELLDVMDVPGFNFLIDS